MHESVNSTSIKAKFQSALLATQELSKLCTETGSWCTPDQIAISGANGRGNTRGNKLLKKLCSVIDQVLDLNLQMRSAKPSLEQAGLMVAITSAADQAIANNGNAEGVTYVVHLDLIKSLICLCKTLIDTTKGFSFGKFAIGTAIGVGIAAGACFAKKHFFDDDDA